MLQQFRREKMKKVLLIVLTAALLQGITACNAKKNTGDGKIKIAYVVKAMTDQFWIDMRNGAEEAAREHNVELSFQAPEKETDFEKQIQMVENAIIQKVDAIILSAASSTALNPAIIKANKAKIPVILVNDTIDNAALEAEGGFVETYVGIDQYAAAALAGKYCTENISGGKVLLLEGPSGVDALEQRLAGFRDNVAGKPGFIIAASQTANCDRNEGFNVMQNILTSVPDISVVWSVNAEMGQGAIQAIEQAGRNGTISVFDFDASNDDIEAIKAGTLVGSVDQYPAIQARAAIQACLDVLNGKKLAPHTVTKAELTTAANVN
jgi:ABC-type sugar transport system substrate-binding protein